MGFVCPKDCHSLSSSVRQFPSLAKRRLRIQSAIERRAFWTSSFGFCILFCTVFVAPSVHLRLPDRRVQTKGARNQIVSRGFLATPSRPPASFPRELWLLGELLLVGDPLLLIAPTLAQCSDAAAALVNPIVLLPYAIDFLKP